MGTTDNLWEVVSQSLLHLKMGVGVYYHWVVSDGCWVMMECLLGVGCWVIGVKCWVLLICWMTVLDE